jgi:hypothetical protein
MSGAKNVLFNLNTIESIMLTSTIMVNLAGIMLLSGQFENLEPHEEFQRDIITYTIILVITSSFFILFCSLAREIWLARTLSKNMARAKWRAIIRRVKLRERKKRALVKRFQNVVYDVMRKNNIGQANHESYLKSTLHMKKNSVLKKNSVFRKKNSAVTPLPTNDIQKLDTPLPTDDIQMLVPPVQEEVLALPMTEVHHIDAEWDNDAEVRVPRAHSQMYLRLSWAPFLHLHAGCFYRSIQRNGKTALSYLKLNQRNE